MKAKSLLLTLFIGCNILISSCKKEHAQPDNTGKAYKVHIGIDAGDFTQQITALSKSKTLDAVSGSASLASIIHNLYFYILNSSGKIVFSASQVNYYADFGSIDAVIVPGNYQLIVYGGAAIDTTYKLASPGWDFESGSYTSYPWPDCFYYNAPLVISSSDVNRTVALNRMISQVEVVIKDALPPSVKTIELWASNNDINFNILTNKFIPIQGTDRGLTVTTTIPDSLAGKTNFTTSVNIIPDTTHFYSTITCYDGNKNIVAFRQFDPITLAPNQQVIYSIGSMFGGTATPNSAFQVTVNTGWKTSTVTKSF